MLNVPSLRATLPLALLLLAAGCKPAAQPQGPPPAAVTVVAAEPREVAVTYEYVGQTAGFREVEVRSRVTGILLKRNYQAELNRIDALRAQRAAVADVVRTLGGGWTGLSEDTKQARSQ